MSDKKTALDHFNECGGGDEADPVERLRFFCSCGNMEGQDWLDIEEFFDGVIAKVDALQAEVDRYRGAIKKWLDGDYPNPRRNRPHDCMHGVGYWQSCENCEEEYWTSVLEQSDATHYDEHVKFTGNP